jgi:protein phosphatase
VLVGAAGSGKSTFAARHFPPDAVLSSDAFRAILAGDEADQSVTRTAFSILHREAAKRLAAGRLVVVDATNVERHARIALLARARAVGVPAIAIVFALPAATVLARNAARAGRSVDTAVVERHLAVLAAILEGGGASVLEAEGFDRAYVLASDADVAAVRLERRANPDPSPQSPT